MESKFDVWLSRLTQIAQLGLFILAVFGFFYTVVPLYQNAVLTEAIAKKELKVSELRGKINFYKAKALVNRVNGFILVAGGTCSGLTQDEHFKQRMNSFLHGKNPGPDPVFIFLKNNPTDVCLRQFYDSRKQLLSDATKESRMKFESMLNKIEKDLENKREGILKSSASGDIQDALMNYSSDIHNELSKLSDIKMEVVQEQ